MKKKIIGVLIILFFLTLFSQVSRARVALIGLEGLVEGAYSIVLGKVEYSELSNISLEQKIFLRSENTMRTVVGINVEQYLKNDLRKDYITVSYEENRRGVARKIKEGMDVVVFIEGPKKTEILAKLFLGNINFVLFGDLGIYYAENGNIIYHELKGRTFEPQSAISLENLVKEIKEILEKQ